MQHFDGCKQFPEVLSDFGQYLMSNDQTEAACVVYEVCILNITLRKPCRRRQKNQLHRPLRACSAYIRTTCIIYVHTFYTMWKDRFWRREGKGREKRKAWERSSEVMCTYCICVLYTLRTYVLYCVKRKEKEGKEKIESEKGKGGGEKRRAWERINAWAMQWCAQQSINARTNFTRSVLSLSLSIQHPRNAL